MKKFLVIVLLLFTAGYSFASAPLRIGVLLIEDSVPLYVADQQGYFNTAGVEVELVPFLSALERDSAIAAGAIDGAVSDPVGAILFDRRRNIIQITSLCLGKTPGEGVFAILSSPRSGITEINQLKGVPIAISNATIIEYVTERLLEEQGFAADQIKTIEVKKMPIRMQMLLSDSVEAATLPEPLASIAASKGARILLTDSTSTQSLSQTVIIFRKETLDARAEEITHFFAGLSAAVSDLNNNQEKYRALFVEKGRIPPFLAENYPIPQFPTPEPFSKELYVPVMEWLQERQLVNPISYETMVSTDFLGK